MNMKIKFIYIITFVILIIITVAGISLFYWNDAKVLKGIEITYDNNGKKSDAMEVYKRYQEYANLINVNRCDTAWNQYVDDRSKTRHEDNLSSYRALVEEEVKNLPDEQPSNKQSLNRGLEGLGESLRKAGNERKRHENEYLKLVSTISYSNFESSCHENLEASNDIKYMVITRDRADIAIISTVNAGSGERKEQRSMTWLRQADGQWYRDW